MTHYRSKRPYASGSDRHRAGHISVFATNWQEDFDGIPSRRSLQRDLPSYLDLAFVMFAQYGC